jgi:hypothetical protein
MDIIYLSIPICFLLVSWGLVVLCESLRGER